MCREQLRLIEPTIVPDVWIDGIGKIEKIEADTYRVLLYRTRHPIEGGPPEHEIMASVLTSGAKIRAALTFAGASLMGNLGVETTMEVLTLVQ